jgi:hypothetical protein
VNDLAEDVDRVEVRGPLGMVFQNRKPDSRIEESMLPTRRGYSIVTFTHTMQQAAGAPDLTDRVFTARRNGDRATHHRPIRPIGVE